MNTAVQDTQEMTILEIPIISGQPQAQGDLLILDWPTDCASARRSADVGKAKSLPVKGEVVLLGDDGHAHLLTGDEGVNWYRYPGQANQTLGVVVVEPGGLAVLGHEEHGDSHIGEGVYVIRRQREQADQIRLVAD